MDTMQATNTALLVGSILSLLLGATMILLGPFDLGCLSVGFGAAGLVVAIATN